MHFDLIVLGTLRLLLTMRDANGRVVVLVHQAWPVLFAAELLEEKPQVHDLLDGLDSSHGLRFSGAQRNGGLQFG